MAIDATKKKYAWIARFVADLIASVEATRKATLTASEYSTDAFNGGDQANRPEYTITDADLIAAGYAHLNAAKLNSAVGGLAAMQAAYDANAGFIEAARP